MTWPRVGWPKVRTPKLDLRRSLRVIWVGTASPPAGAAQDPVAYIASRATSETGQSLVSLAKGEGIRSLCEPKSTITASSSSTRTTQPRPYLSWVT